MAQPHTCVAVEFSTFECVRQASGLSHRTPGYVEITCSDPALFKRMPPSEYQRTAVLLRGAHRRVQDGRMSKTAFGELETASGFSFNPRGVMQSDEVRMLANPVDVVTYDWVHSLLQGGVLVVEMEAIMTAASLDRGALQKFLADPAWSFPQASATKYRQLHRVFDERRMGEDDDRSKIRGSCAEFLGLYGMLRCFVALQLGETEEHAAHVRSFNAACAIVDCILDIKRCILDVAGGADKLERLIKCHMDTHIAVYGSAHIKPKHHWVADLPAQIRRDGLVADCFIVERTHLAVKAVAQEIDRTTVFERSALASLSTVTFRDRHLHNDGLIGRSAPLGGAIGMRVANRMRMFGAEFVVGDVVTLGANAGCVAACCEQDEVLALVVQPLELESRISDHCDVCKPLDRLATWRATAVQQTLAWRRRADGSILVVRR